jgi:hypothetical protein
LKYNGKYYLPKYIISIANKYANGRELRTSEFSGGSESISFLRALGFEGGPIGSQRKNISQSQFTSTKPNTTKDARNARSA